DDTKALKGSIIDWITPKAQNLDPPLHQNIKSTQGFGHPQTKLQSGETLVTSDQWPLFLYAGLDYDSTDPWKGLLRNNLFVLAYKHIFLSPSSVNSNTEARATHSSNARLHGMHQVTRGSIAYIATQVHFALLAQSVFSRTDTITDSEGFFNSILGLLQDPNEIEEDNDLLAWWNQYVLDCPPYILVCSVLNHHYRKIFPSSLRQQNSVLLLGFERSVLQ
ncbi:hypothetical protein SERLA73DRAFT_66102, partial [Serpula lacrymans var. lacrymans S7.3]